MAITIPVVGTDGGVPIYEPTARWTIWNLAEVYLGGDAAGRYIPKVNDYVTDTETGAEYICTGINELTYVPVLTKRTKVVDEGFSEAEKLIGINGYSSSETYRLYIDKSVVPFQMAVDARLMVGGTLTNYARIVKGSSVSGDEKIISQFYDQSGNLVGVNIPLELIALANGQNVSIKTVAVGHTVEDLPDGELVTIIIYSADGHVRLKRELMVVNTRFIRSVDVSKKYVTGISIKSPFVSPSDPTTIRYPLGTPVENLNLMGRVHYSDGKIAERAIDGTKFALYGLDTYVSSVIGQKIDVVLSYTLSSDEISYCLAMGPNNTINEAFKAITSQPDGSYTVKLFPYPEWRGEISGYTLRWFLYDLNREVALDVTPLVVIQPGSRPFDPISFGVRQNLSVSLTLSDISGAYKSVRHVQTVAVVLNHPSSSTPWEVLFDSNQTSSYGQAIYAESTYIQTDLSMINLAPFTTDFETWMQKVYRNTKPLYNPEREVSAPEPNMFSLTIAGVTVEYRIEEWNTIHTFNANLTLYCNAYIRFFKRTAENDIELSTAALVVKQVN